MFALVKFQFHKILAELNCYIQATVKLSLFIMVPKILNQTKESTTKITTKITERSRQCCLHSFCKPSPRIYHERLFLIFTSFFPAVYSSSISGATPQVPMVRNTLGYRFSAVDEATVTSTVLCYCLYSKTAMEINISSE